MKRTKSAKSWPKSVLILHDTITPNAKPDEVDSLDQANTVAGVLRKRGYEVERREVSFDLRDLAGEIGMRRPDVVFNLVESLEGKGRYIHFVPAMLEALKVPYTGAPADALFLTSHKPTAKRLMERDALPTPRWTHLGGPPPSWRGRSIVKSTWEHASVGLDTDSVMPPRRLGELEKEMRERGQRYGGEFYAEEYIDGREFNLSVLGGPKGREVFPPAEILFEGFAARKPKVVGYRAKWDENSFDYNNTDRTFDFAPSDKPLLDQLVKMSARCWDVFQLRGYARVDFRVDKKGKPWILEINANPCINPNSGFTAAVARGGVSYERMLERILADSVKVG